MSNLPPGLDFLVHLRLVLSFARDCKSEDPLARLDYGIIKTLEHYRSLSKPLGVGEPWEKKSD